MKLSVLLPVYKPCRSEFIACLHSIVNQSYKNFELIIIDDGSNFVLTDNDFYLLEQLERYKLVKLIKNMGLPYALNIGIKNSSGDFIARIDADDICFPTRFEEQLIFLEHNPHIDMVGSWAQCIGDDSKVIKPFYEHKHIYLHSLFDSPMVHPSVLGKRQVFELFYNVDFIKAQDYELWTRALMTGYRFCNIQKPLIYYRVREKGNSSYDQKLFSELVRISFIGKIDFLTFTQKENLLSLANRHLKQDLISFASLLELIYVLRSRFGLWHTTKLFLSNYIKSFSRKVF